MVNTDHHCQVVKKETSKDICVVWIMPMHTSKYLIQIAESHPADAHLFMAVSRLFMAFTRLGFLICMQCCALSQKPSLTVRFPWKSISKLGAKN